MGLFKTSIWGGLSVLVKILTMLTINKIIAIYVGPTGYAIAGQFQNILQIITVFSGGAINNGVVKYTAEYHDNENYQCEIWKAATFIVAIMSILILTIIFTIDRNLTQEIFKDIETYYIFLFTGIALIPTSLNYLLLSILNGKNEIKIYAIANITGSIFALIITIYLTITLKIYGILIALATYQAFGLLTTIFISRRFKWLKFSAFIGKPKLSAIKKLSKYFLMGASTAIAGPFTYYMVRNHISENYGLEYAGYWEAMWRISGAYLLFITMTLSIYYLPTLSRIKKKEDIKNKIKDGYIIILPVVASLLILIYLTRNYIILLLFNNEFLFISNFFAWQLIGDLLKIGSWLLSYLALSKGMTTIYIYSEILFGLVFYTSSIFFLEEYGINSVGMAYTISYGIFWLYFYYFGLIRLK